MGYKDGGYYPKYEVTNNRTGERVTEPAFTLIPSKDPHARKAVLAYAESVRDENHNLARDLIAAFGGVN